MKRRFEGSCQHITAVQSSPPRRSRVKKWEFIQAVLLTWVHRSLRLPKTGRFSDICEVRSPLQRRDRAGLAPDFSVGPFRAPVSLLYSVFNTLHRKPEDLIWPSRFPCPII